MRVDTVITFYRQERHWPLISWGLLQNASSISKAIVVRDEPLNECDTLTIDGYEVTQIGHDHDGFGVARCHNEGMKQATTEYVAHINGDTVLSPGALEMNLRAANPGRLIFGRVHTLPPDTTVPDLAHPRFMQNDCYLKTGWKQNPHYVARGAFWIAHRQSYLNMGGWDETMREYGYQDYDFTLRWMRAYGLSSVVSAPGAAWHIGLETQNQRNEHSYNWTRCKESLRLLQEQYPALRGERLED